MINKEIHLEPIPGINLGNEDEKKENESKINQNEQIPPEANKNQQDNNSSQAKKDSSPSIDPKTRKKIEDFSEKLLKEKKYKYRISSSNISPSLDFLGPFVILEDKDEKDIILEDNINRRSDKDSSNKQKFLEYDENGIRHLYVPTLFFIKDGAVVEFHEGTLEGHNAKLRAMTAEEREELKQILLTKFAAMSDGEKTGS